MFPLRDINPTRITPVLTLALIAINVGIFFLFQMRGSTNDQQELIYERAAIACEVTTGDPLGVEEIDDDICLPGAQAPIFPDKNVFLALVTSMFLHGSVAHVLFNMWFLWIFGNNVEEAYGHVGYLLVYLIGGLAATATYVVLNQDATVPLVGASGAIAVALGAYAVLFPGHRVLSFVGWILIPVPAVIFLAIWFVLQFVTGQPGVAWEAHAGGFVFGAGVSLLLRSRLLRRVGAGY
ncbi:MAG TPA: rhomboid family intramembrane serine protease [Acidimicrobiia bacterium]|nr:rhomboid family intramembrane serine protease [Acidimicrobiia bacterium]